MPTPGHLRRLRVLERVQLTPKIDALRARRDHLRTEYAKVARIAGPAERRVRMEQTAAALRSVHADLLAAEARMEALLRLTERPERR